MWRIVHLLVKSSIILSLYVIGYFKVSYFPNILFSLVMFPLLNSFFLHFTSFVLVQVRGQYGTCLMAQLEVAFPLSSACTERNVFGG